MLFYQCVSTLLAVLGLATSVAAKEADILLLTVDEWSPYIENSPPNYGFLSRIVKEAFAAETVQVQLRFEPWKRVENGLDSQNYFSFAYVKTAEREARWLFSEPIVRSQSVFVTNEKHRQFVWKNWTDLAPFRIGITQAYSYGAAFELHRDALKLVSSYTDVISLKALLHDRVDLVLMESRVAQSLIAKHFKSDEQRQFVLIKSPEVSSGDLYLVCAKINPQCSARIAQFNRGLAQLSMSGRLKMLQ